MKNTAEKQKKTKLIKVLNREGCKHKFVEEITSLFPPHERYIEPFLGTGSIFFNKAPAKYNTLNDSSKFIYNYFAILKDEKSILDFCKKMERVVNYFDMLKEDDSMEAYITRLLTSFYGNFSTPMLTGKRDVQRNFIENLLNVKEILIEKLKFAKICNMDAFKFLSCIFDSKNKNNYGTFIYCDPPYSISKGALNDNKGWSIEKLEQLIDKLLTLNCLFAISEYNDSEILELARVKGLKINYIAKAGFNKVIGKSEILMTSYDAKDKSEKDLFDLID